MKQLFQENRNAFLALIGLLFILLLAVYFLFYRPLAAELTQAETAEQQLNDEITVLQAKTAALSSADEDGKPKEMERIRLEPQLPSEANLDEFLLVLNQIELVSNSRIETMAFSYQGQLPERFPGLTDEEEADDVDQVQAHLETAEERAARLAEIEAEKAAEAEAEAAEDVEDLEEEAEELPAISYEDMPAGLEPIMVSLNVQSPDYEHFQIFLQEIENQERIMIVPSLSFDQPVESDLIFMENPDETVDVSIDVMTFYYEG